MLFKIGLLAAIFVGALAGCQRQESAPVSKPKVAAAASTTPAAPDSKMSELEFRKGMALDEVKEIRYRDEAGEMLSFSQFISTVQAGRSFSKTVEGDKSLATMTLNPVAKTSPKSAESSEAPQLLNFPISAQLPPIENTDLSGHAHALANGKNYTLLSFFFADCVPCIQEIPALNVLGAGHGSLKVISVTFEDRGVASKFARERGLKVPIIPESQSYIDALGIKVYPSLVLISPEGRLMGIHTSSTGSGSQDSGLAEIESWLQSLGLKV